MVRAVVFDVGETLLDERGLWHRWADWLDVPRQHFMDTLKGVARRGDASPRAGLVGVFLRRASGPRCIVPVPTPSARM